MWFRMPLAVALVLVLGGTAVASAKEIEGVAFAPSHRAGDVSLSLECVGLLRYRVVFKGYVAALYLPDAVPAVRALEDVPKRLELSYFWSIEGPKFGAAADDILARGFDDATLKALRPRLDLLHSWYTDVRPGDRYALTYVPGRGTELSLNGQPRGVIEGADFAAAYFSIWLGPQPIDEALRDQLTTCS